MNQSTPPRPGLNQSEAAIAWAYARFGGDVEALTVLQDDSAGLLGTCISELPEEDEAERTRVVELWREQDRRWDNYEAMAFRLSSEKLEAYASQMDPRWKAATKRLVARSGRQLPWHDNSVRTRRAIVWLALRGLREEMALERPELRDRAGLDLVGLAAMSPPERDDFVRQLGVFQLAELAREQDRRNLVRLRRALQAEDRDWFDDCICREREMERAEKGRIRELFLAVSRQEPDLAARLMHLGLYSLAAAAGARFAPELRSIARRLPTTMRTLLLHYHGIDLESAPGSLGPAFRHAVVEYMRRRRGEQADASSPEEVSHDD